MNEPYILVVEDDEETGLLLKVWLTRREYVVEVAQDALTAQKSLSKKIPDLILMDVMMPDMSGIELSQWVRSQTATQNVPIIQMSALGDETTIQDSMEMGAMDFIVKPINFDLLEGKMDLAIVRAQRRTAADEPGRNEEPNPHEAE